MSARRLTAPLAVLGRGAEPPPGNGPGEASGLAGNDIALTFDDGPDPVWTPRVLDALAATGARATFFVVSPLADRHPGHLRRVADEWHQVALHCNHTARHDHMGADEIVSDATDGQ